MPLGIQQNNNFAQIIVDIWNDKVFYQDSLRDLWLRPF